MEFPKPRSLSANREKEIRSLLRKKERDREGLFLAEGFHLLEEALRGGLHPVLEIYAAEAALPRIETLARAFPPLRGLPVYLAAPSRLARLSTEESPQGVVFLCRKTAVSPAAPGDGPGPVILYLEEMADPGNLGTILRTAAWFDVRPVLLGPRSADRFNPKVLRASAGAVFHLEVLEETPPEAVREWASRTGRPVVAAVPEGGVPPREAKKDGACILLLGNESRGLSRELLDLASRRVTIPRRGSGESLNVALSAAILLYEFFR
jgi:TrmH family RNA methyltransferase